MDQYLRPSIPGQAAGSHRTEWESSYAFEPVASVTPPPGGLLGPTERNSTYRTCQNAACFAYARLPLGKLYTLGIQFLIGRAHAVSLLPEVMQLIGERRLRPEEVTTRVVDWEDAPTAWLEDSIKLVVTRD
jgi:hypothetical protein